MLGLNPGPLHVCIRSKNTKNTVHHLTISHSRFRSHLPSGLTSSTSLWKKPFFGFPSENSLIKDRKSRCRYQNNLPAAYRVFLKSPMPEKLHFKPGCAMVESRQSSIPSISLCSISNLAVQGSSRSKPLFLLYLSAPFQTRLCNGWAEPILYSFYISPFQNGRTGPNLSSF